METHQSGTGLSSPGAMDAIVYSERRRSQSLVNLVATRRVIVVLMRQKSAEVVVVKRLSVMEGTRRRTELYPKEVMILPGIY